MNILKFGSLSNKHTLIEILNTNSNQMKYKPGEDDIKCTVCFLFLVPTDYQMPDSIL